MQELRASLCWLLGVPGIGVFVQTELRLRVSLFLLLRELAIQATQQECCHKGLARCRWAGKLFPVPIDPACRFRLLRFQAQERTLKLKQIGIKLQAATQQGLLFVREHAAEDHYVRKVEDANIFLCRGNRCEHLRLRRLQAVCHRQDNSQSQRHAAQVCWQGWLQ